MGRKYRTFYGAIPTSVGFDPKKPFTHFPAFARMAREAIFATLRPRLAVRVGFGDLRAGAFSREHQERMKRMGDEAKR